MLQKIGKMLIKAGKICLIIFMALIALVILPFIAGPIIDNMALRHFKASVLKDLDLPPGTDIIETVSGCGNTGGTGNHTELYVAILVKSTLSEAEWEEYGLASHKVSADGAETWAMGCVGQSFSRIDNTDGLYILEYAKSAPCSDFDLRGH